MIGRRELTSEDVRRLVFKSIRLIEGAQEELDLKICPNIHETKKKLSNGTFRAERLIEKPGIYQMAYGSFDPPATIVLDMGLPFCDRPLDLPEIPRTMTYYTSIHEVIHADDHFGGDSLLKATLKHILREHWDKLEMGMRVVEEGNNCDCIKSYWELACLWAIQYIDILTHYRSLVILRHHGFPKLDVVWEHMQNDYFPPGLITKIERVKDTKYIFEKIIEKAGEYCIIDALFESEKIGDKRVKSYTV